MRCELIESLMMLSMVVMAGGGMVGARRVARERVAEASGAMGPVHTHNGRIGRLFLVEECRRVGLGNRPVGHRGRWAFQIAVLCIADDSNHFVQMTLPSTLCTCCPIAFLPGKSIFSAARFRMIFIPDALVSSHRNSRPSSSGIRIVWK